MFIIGSKAICAYDTSTQSILQSFLHNDQIISSSLIEKLESLWIADDKGQITVLSINKQSLLTITHQLNVTGNIITSLTHSDIEPFTIWGCGADGNVYQWDGETYEMLHNIKVASCSLNVIHESFRHVWVGGQNGDVYCCDENVLDEEDLNLSLTDSFDSEMSLEKTNKEMGTVQFFKKIECRSANDTVISILSAGEVAFVGFQSGIVKKVASDSISSHSSASASVAPSSSMEKDLALTESHVLTQFHFPRPIKDILNCGDSIIVLTSPLRPTADNLSTIFVLYRNLSDKSTVFRRRIHLGQGEVPLTIVAENKEEEEESERPKAEDLAEKCENKHVNEKEVQPTKKNRLYVILSSNQCIEFEEKEEAKESTPSKQEKTESMKTPSPSQKLNETKDSLSSPVSALQSSTLTSASQMSSISPMFTPVSQRLPSSVNTSTSLSSPNISPSLSSISEEEVRTIIPPTRFLQPKMKEEKNEEAEEERRKEMQRENEMEEYKMRIKRLEEEMKKAKRIFEEKQQIEDEKNEIEDKYFELRDEIAEERRKNEEKTKEIEREKEYWADEVKEYDLQIAKLKEENKKLNADYLSEKNNSERITAQMNELKSDLKREIEAVKEKEEKERKASEEELEQERKKKEEAEANVKELQKQLNEKEEEMERRERENESTIQKMEEMIKQKEEKEMEEEKQNEENKQILIEKEAELKSAKNEYELMKNLKEEEIKNLTDELQKWKEIKENEQKDENEAIKKLEQIIQEKNDIIDKNADEMKEKEEELKNRETLIEEHEAEIQRLKSEIEQKKETEERERRGREEENEEREKEHKEKMEELRKQLMQKDEELLRKAQEMEEKERELEEKAKEIEEKTNEVDEKTKEIEEKAKEEEERNNDLAERIEKEKEMKMKIEELEEQIKTFERKQQEQEQEKATENMEQSEENAPKKEADNTHTTPIVPKFNLTPQFVPLSYSSQLPTSSPSRFNHTSSASSSSSASNPYSDLTAPPSSISPPLFNSPAGSAARQNHLMSLSNLHTSPSSSASAQLLPPLPSSSALTPRRAKKASEMPSVVSAVTPIHQYSLSYSPSSSSSSSSSPPSQSPITPRSSLSSSISTPFFESTASLLSSLATLSEINATLQLSTDQMLASLVLYWSAHKEDEMLIGDMSSALGELILKSEVEAVEREKEMVEFQVKLEEKEKEIERLEEGSMRKTLSGKSKK
ncbi:uncharacterized protein MONOS_4477 [Monocercomonoides exilis]|uniref:uncharacterized protein n=1 Tax=Monocercomonoides exilis TaxID=2049356 RepID=UPI00355A165D|nr:hypothetical protein MONOS_4477 [Monocercomonoides exilis]|eukprot:MONOS_4477.1-p1 / transcript=MONOS_4477.1 / gene=MONOS_4477 / organism=Monocercomonoides_exilis_PA203 / gene_product=unspecified product / transcript_product=unspecified product / location=Mono_scaffold00119:79220-82993(-) / protein_length=1207 / sequence_SO=supercontig / SO=protein_coding / is_pseudo=false